MNISIFGAGAWGTAFAIHLSRLDNNFITIIPRRREFSMKLIQDRENKDYLPNFIFNEKIKIGFESSSTINNADIIILACPSYAIRPLIKTIKNNIKEINSIKAILVLSKGLESQTLKLPISILEEYIFNIPCGVIYGPNFAIEIAQSLPSASIIAMNKDKELTKRIKENFSNKDFIIYQNNDLQGVQIGGALKNIYAIGAGICNGLNFKHNTKAFYITKSLKEMVKIGTALGGLKDTFYGLSGLGDLIATCSSEKSRNFVLGKNLVQKKLDHNLILNRKQVIEGILATNCFFRLVKNYNIKTPILNEIYKILFLEKKIEDSILDLTK